MQQNTNILESIFTLSRLMKEGMRYNTNIMHLSLLQIQALVFLKHSNNAQMSDVANYFKIELPSATSLINKLVKDGLVKRATDEKDKRLVRIALTEKGTELLSNAMKERNKKMSDILSSLTDDEKVSFLKLLEKFIATIEKSNEK